MSLNKYDSSTGTLTNIASGSRTWIGTKAAFEQAKQAGTLPTNAVIMITDDEDDTIATEVIEGDTRAVTGGAVYAAIGSMGSRIRKDITSLVQDGTLETAIAEQNLEKYGINIGDYFTGASGYRYTIAHKDPFYGGYDSYSVVSTHHIGIVVGTKTTAQWNTSDSTSTGYSGSNLKTYLTGTVLNNVRSDIAALTGDSYTAHILTHQKLYTTANENWSWSTDQSIAALSEIQIYGSKVWSLNGYQDGEACIPLEVFQKFRYNEILGNQSVWLRNIQSSSSVCGAGIYGYAYFTSASNTLGVAGLILFH